MEYESDEGLYWRFGVSGWFAFAMPGVLPVVWAVSRVLGRNRRGLCPVCGYNLTGNTSGLCPECRRAVARKAGA